MTKMNAFLRGVSPTVCRNLQFWNTAFNFDFYIQLIPLHQQSLVAHLGVSYLDKHTAAARRPVLVRPAMFSKYPAMLTLKYFWGVPSHAYTQIHIRVSCFLNDIFREDQGQ